jgi:hypothetical protein
MRGLIDEFIFPPETEQVVGIARDGLPVALAISYKLGVPLGVAWPQRCSERVVVGGPISLRRPTLIVDDTTRTGKTLKLVKTKFDDPLTVVLFTDHLELVDLSIMPPGDEWIVPEWEQDEESTVYETGFDLDGVICPDARPWERMLYMSEAWVHARQRRKCILVKPPRSALIVTGRPERDASLTIDWLVRHGIYNAIIFNKGEPTKADAVKTKVQAIETFSIKRFYESDPEQADALRAACPWVEVIVP